MIVGAALGQWAEDGVRPRAHQGVPSGVYLEHKHAVERVKIWGKAAWHVFGVQQSLDLRTADCKAWKFWDGLELLPGVKKRSFVHTILGEPKSIELFESFGETTIKEANRSNVEGLLMSLSARSELSANMTPTSIGYLVNGKRALRIRSDDDAYHEYLGGPNVVPVQKSYILVSIPPKYISGMSHSWISFSPQVSPIGFIKSLINKERLEDLSSNLNEEFSEFAPWGFFGNMKEIRDNKIKSLILPELLRKNMEKHGFFEKIDDNRVFIYEFDLPSPLTYQAMVYPLPKN